MYVGYGNTFCVCCEERDSGDVFLSQVFRVIFIQSCLAILFECIEDSVAKIIEIWMKSSCVRYFWY